MKEHNTILNNDLIFILSLLGYIYLVSILTMVYFNERSFGDYVHYTGCYQPISDYSAEFGKSSDTILNQCGENNQSRCVLNVNNLTQAVNFAQQNEADKFSYNEKTGFVALLDSKNTKYINNPTSAIYTKNNHSIVQNTNGATSKQEIGTQSTALNGNVVQGTAVSNTTALGTVS